jgi:uncharacterized membrane protein
LRPGGLARIFVDSCNLELFAGCPFRHARFFEWNDREKAAQFCGNLPITLSKSLKGEMMSDRKEPGLSDNSIGALAYFTPIPAIFFLAIRRYNKRPYVRFHSWQSLVFSAFVFLASYGMSWLLSLTAFLGPRLSLGLWWVFVAMWGAIFLIWVWLVVGALNGRKCKLPIIGAWADEQAYR